MKTSPRGGTRSYANHSHTCVVSLSLWVSDPERDREVCNGPFDSWWCLLQNEQHLPSRTATSKPRWLDLSRCGAGQPFFSHYEHFDTSWKHMCKYVKLFFSSFRCERGNLLLWKRISEGSLSCFWALNRRRSQEAPGSLPACAHKPSMKPINYLFTAPWWKKYSNDIKSSSTRK